MDTEVLTHGKGGWKLLDYRWLEKTGQGRFTYVRGTAIRVTHRNQTDYFTKDAETITYGANPLDNLDSEF